MAYRTPATRSYIYNATGAAGYSGRLLGLLDGLSREQALDGVIGLGSTSKSVLALATDSAGWLEGHRSTTSGELDDKTILAERSIAAWQSCIGVNVDDEMTALMALQRSYQASTRLISAVNDMFGALFQALR